MRNPRREPRQTDNLVAAYEQALVAQGERAARTCWRWTPI